MFISAGSSSFIELGLRSSEGSSNCERRRSPTRKRVSSLRSRFPKHFVINGPILMMFRLDQTESWLTKHLSVSEKLDFSVCIEGVIIQDFREGAPNLTVIFFE